MVKHSVLFLIVSLLSSISMGRQTPEFDLVKQEWLNKANQHVEDEKIKFLASFGLNKALLNNREAIEGLRSSHDQMVQEEIQQYEKKAAAVDESIQNLANQVFKEYEVKVVHDEECEFEDIFVTQNYETGICYVGLNCSKHQSNLELLKKILYHERSHIIHEDNFNKELIQCIAWVNSHDSHDEIAEKSLLYCTAFEIRADTHAVLNSSDNGKQYYRFLQKLPEDPCMSERLAWLKELIGDLNTRESNPESKVH